MKIVDKTKEFILDVSGYTSPTKHVYQQIKEDIDNKEKVKNKENQDINCFNDDGYYDYNVAIVRGVITSQEIASSIRNIKVTCFLMLAMIVYSIFMAVTANDTLSIIVALSSAYIVGAFYIKYIFGLWQLKTKECKPFKDWISLVKQKPKYILPY